MIDPRRFLLAARAGPCASGACAIRSSPRRRSCRTRTGSTRLDESTTWYISSRARESFSYKHLSKRIWSCKIECLSTESHSCLSKLMREVRSCGMFLRIRTNSICPAGSITWYIITLARESIGLIVFTVFSF